MGELTGKTALITGGARGLGAAIAEVFVREGAQVVITDVLEKDGDSLVKQLGKNALFMGHDVTDQAQWQRAVDYICSKLGGVDILVNNAGIVGVYTLSETTLERWDKLIAIMETGPYLGMRTVIPFMEKVGGGSIVNIASTNSLQGMANSAAYTAAKHGVLGLTRALALEYASCGIRINAVCPGAMKTPMLKSSFGDQMDAFAEHVPLGRLSDPHEVAELVSFVASPRASFCTGAAFVADGGMTVG